MRRPYYQRGLRYRETLEEIPLPELQPAPTRRERLLRVLPVAISVACVLVAAATRLDAPPTTVLPPISEAEFAQFIEQGQTLVIPERRAPAPHTGAQEAVAPAAPPEPEVTPEHPAAAVAPEPNAVPALVTFVDAHAHAIPGVAPAELVQAMDRAGLRQAVLMPLGPDEDTRKAADAFPGRFIPFAGGGQLLSLTRYGGAAAWNLTAAQAKSYLAALDQAISNGAYRGIGELVIDPPTYADAPLTQALMKLAADQNAVLVVTMNGTAPGIARLERALDANPAARVVWAGCGAVPAPQAQRLLAGHPNLFCDLSGRDADRYGRTAPITDARGTLLPAWKALLEEMPERFLVGTDARNPAEWRGRYTAWAGWHQKWLAQLSPDAASWIAERNLGRIIGG